MTKISLEKSLVENLEMQVEMHQILLDVLTQEKELKASCTLAELEEIHQTRNFATTQISELEVNRIQIVKNLQQTLKTRQNLTLDEIIRGSDMPIQKELTALKQALKATIDQIQQTGKVNAEKAVARIACFSNLQDAVHKSFHRHSIYSMYGVVSRPKGACFLQKSI